MGSLYVCTAGRGYLTTFGDFFSHSFFLGGKSSQSETNGGATITRFIPCEAKQNRSVSKKLESTTERSFRWRYEIKTVLFHPKPISLSGSSLDSGLPHCRAARIIGRSKSDCVYQRSTSRWRKGQDQHCGPFFPTPA
jgi:hypothetical protein